MIFFLQLFAVLKWLATLHERGAIRAAGVASDLSWRQWAARIAAHFEHAYYVPLSAADDAQYACDAALVNRRGIYRDVVG